MTIFAPACSPIFLAVAWPHESIAESPSISTVIDWLVFRSFVLFIYQQNKHISITYSATPPFLYFLSRQTALEKLRWYLNQSHSYEQNHLWDVSLSCNTGHGGATFPKVALGSLRGSLALFWKDHGVQSPWLAVSQTYLSALFSCQRTTTACQPVKANSRTSDFYRMTSGVAGKGRTPRPPVCI